MQNVRDIYGRGGTHDSKERPFPIPLPNLAATLAEMADGHNYHELAAAIRARGVDVQIGEYDNWDGGIWEWHYTISIPPRLFAKISKQRNEIQAQIAKDIASLLPCDWDSISGVDLVPLTVHSKNRVTNQGRGHSQNPAAIEHEGLFFRSRAEIHLFHALRLTGLPLMPLPVVVSNREMHRRIEPDFLLVKGGMLFIVEVDGARFHQETPAEAQQRLRHLEDEGARIIRVNASQCCEPATAKRCAADIVERIERLLASR